MLQRSSPVPLYQQLKLLLAERIKRGEWKPGELIPGEHELQAIHRLSRTTVRQALQELEREGFVTRHRGRGTFVAQPRAASEAGPRLSIHEHLLAQGIHPGWQLLSAEEQPAGPEVAARLQIPVGASVLYTRRIRLGDERPLGYLEAHVPVELLGPLDPQQLTVGGSLDYLRNKGLLRGSHAERTVTADAASEEEAALLGMVPGAPVLKIHRVTSSADGRPIESCCSAYCGERFRYRLPTTRESP